MHKTAMSIKVKLSVILAMYGGLLTVFYPTHERVDATIIKFLLIAVIPWIVYLICGVFFKSYGWVFVVGCMAAITTLLHVINREGYAIIISMLLNCGMSIIALLFLGATYLSKKNKLH